MTEAPHTLLQLPKSPLIIRVVFHDADAVGVGFDEPGEELGVVDLFGEHLLSALSADMLAVRGVEPLLYGVEEAVDICCLVAESKLIDIFDLVEVCEPSGEVVQAHERCAQDAGFRSHGLAVSDEQVSVGHDVENIHGIDVDAVGLQFRLQRPFRGDIDVAVDFQQVDEAKGRSRIDSLDAGIVVGGQLRETDEIEGLVPGNAVLVQFGRVRSKGVRMKICQFVIGMDTDLFVLPLACAADRRGDDAGEERIKHLGEEGRGFRIIFITIEGRDAEQLPGVSNDSIGSDHEIWLRLPDDAADLGGFLNQGKGQPHFTDRSGAFFDLDILRPGVDAELLQDILGTNDGDDA